MKVSKKQEIQQMTIDNSSDIDFKGFMDLQRKCAVKKYSFFSRGNYSPIRQSITFLKESIGRSIKSNHDR